MPTSSAVSGHTGRRHPTPSGRATILVLAAGAVAAAGVVGLVGAAGGTAESSFVPITPCRLVDTRAAEAVGTRATPIGPNESVTFQVRGTNGNCTIPTAAVGIVSNATAVNPTDFSYLTVWPADATRPLASNLNWTPTSPPTPNQVTVGLSADGAIGAYNKNGTIDVVIDIVGYYVPAAIAGPSPTTSASTSTTPSTTSTTPSTTSPPPQQPPGAYVHTNPNNVALGTKGGPSGAVTINPMFLPAGTYLVTFTATIANFSGTGDIFRCGVFASGQYVRTHAVSLTSGGVAPMTVQAVVTLTYGGTTSVGSSCLHDTDLPAGSKLDPGATLTAVPVTPLANP
jgi:hypothetical protein